MITHTTEARAIFPGMQFIGSSSHTLVSPLRLFAAGVAILGLVLAGGPGSARAQQTSAPSLEAHRTSSSISIDGRLNESAWEQARSASDFLQLEPVEGDAAPQHTAVRVLYGPGGVYVGAIMQADDPGQVSPRLGRRDEYNRADWFTVSIDSYFNQSTAYVFAVNAAGVQYDGLLTGGEEEEGGAVDQGGGSPGPGDPSWDAVWESDVRVGSDGWVAELRIPYSMLRFSESTSTWGIHFRRRIPSAGVRVEWPLVPRTQRSNLVAHFGRLEGLEGIDPERNIQVRPYVLSRFDSEEAPAAPGTAATDLAGDVGGDVKIGLSSNVTLDATVNPDFGQVESDPAVLNLTAFETFYPEKRPFFLEGIQIYNFRLGPPNTGFLYTRRIGEHAPIVGATKLSGRTAGGTSFGVLGAITGEEFSAERYYGVSRLTQEFGEFSTAGAILTGYEGPALATGASAARRRTLTGGVDYDLRFVDNEWGLEGFAGFTRRSLTEGGATETGYAVKASGSRRQGTVTGHLGLDYFGDRFEPNDLGRLQRNNVVILHGDLGYEINGGQPFGSFQRASAGLNGAQFWSARRGLDLGFGPSLTSTWITRNFQQIVLEVSTQNLLGGYDLYETRGLGPYYRPHEIESAIEIQTDQRRSWFVEPEFAYTFTGDGGQIYAAGLRGEWSVGTRLEMSAGADVEWENDAVAWSSNETFRQIEEVWSINRESGTPEQIRSEEYLPLPEADAYLDRLFSDMEPLTAQGHYAASMFGRRDTRSLDLTVRGGYTFTADLSFDLYSQLFVARGRYDEFQILEEPRSLADFSAYPKKDVFTINSFQLNAVLRWEYRPGSTLYLVWTQTRRADLQMNPLAPAGPTPYDRTFGDQFGNTFDLFPTDALILKLNYTFLR